MKNFFRLALICCASVAMNACSSDKSDEPDNDNKTESTAWHLIWTDEFSGSTLDSSHWKRIEPYNPPSSGPDWRKYISTDDACFDFTGSSLSLLGINTPADVNDDRPYICGGITTEGNFNLEPPFRIEVRAKLTDAQGAWPAIWMMPVDGSAGWPACGEIDIMEHLNHDSFIYQTVHSAYTQNGGQPANSTTAYISQGKFNTYGIAVTENAIVWFVNGAETFRYRRVPSAGESQFPFYKDWYLKIDMQLRGSWVGSVNTAQLPVAMEIDWVKYYRYY